MALPMGELASGARLRGKARLPRAAAISWFFDRAMLSLRLFFSVSVLALSVTFGDSSPKGGA